jgi:hypothetical protein
MTPAQTPRSIASLMTSAALRDEPARPHRSTITLGLYAKVVLRRDGEAERLQALVGGEFRQDLGRRARSGPPSR